MTLIMHQVLGTGNERGRCELCLFWSNTVPWFVWKVQPNQTRSSGKNIWHPCSLKFFHIPKNIWH